MVIFVNRYLIFEKLFFPSTLFERLSQYPLYLTIDRTELIGSPRLDGVHRGAINA